MRVPEFPDGFTLAYIYPGVDQWIIDVRSPTKRVTAAGLELEDAIALVNEMIASGEWEVIESQPAKKLTKSSDKAAVAALGDLFNLSKPSGPPMRRLGNARKV